MAVSFLVSFLSARGLDLLASMSCTYTSFCIRVVAQYRLLACENVLWMFGDAEEVGSSDINACVNDIIRDFGVAPAEVSDNQFYMIRIAVRNALRNMEDVRALY